MLSEMLYELDWIQFCLCGNITLFKVKTTLLDISFDTKILHIMDRN